METTIGIVGLAGILALLAGTLTVMPRMYQKRAYRQPAEHDPGLVWFPKYRLPLAGVPPWPEVEARMAKLGFTRNRPGEDGETMRFTRGSPWGDFSIRWAKMDVTVQARPGGSGELFVEADEFVLFDTGDIRALIVELAETLQAATKHLPQGTRKTAFDRRSVTPIKNRLGDLYSAKASFGT